MFFRLLAIAALLLAVPLTASAAAEGMPHSISAFAVVDPPDGDGDDLDDNDRPTQCVLIGTVFVCF